MAKAQPKKTDNVHQLQTHIKSLQKDLEKLNDAVNGEAEPHLRERAQEFVERANGGLKEAAEKSREGIETARTQVQDRPLATTAAAICAGFVLGSLMKNGK